MLRITLRNLFVFDFGFKETNNINSRYLTYNKCQQQQNISYKIIRVFNVYLNPNALTVLALGHSMKFVLQLLFVRHLSVINRVGSLNDLQMYFFMEVCSHLSEYQAQSKLIKPCFNVSK